MTSPARFAWLSIGAAISTILLKSAAYLVTGSVGLLSDAVESFVNLIAAILALIALTIAERPPDAIHTYGHTKAEYFASISEGFFILVAAGSIGYAAISRLAHVTPIEQPGLGIAISTTASLINLVVALVLLRAGKKHRSITLTSDAHHLLTDVWTSVAVIAGIAVVAVTNIQILDPIIALLVSTNIVFSGVRILKQSAFGFMDTAIIPEDMALVSKILAPYEKQGILFHGFRSRQSASRRFLTFHVLVPGMWTVRKGHNVVEKIESDIRSKFEKMTVTTHLEPKEDPRSQQDISIDRE
jgi:cation diffusion facilitator family transporter